MSRMQPYYGSCPPQQRGLTSPTDLMPGQSIYGNSGPVAMPAPVLPQSPVLPQQPAITFIDAYNSQFPLDRETARKLYRPEGSGSESTQQTGVEPGDLSIDDFVLYEKIVQRGRPSRMRADDGYYPDYCPGSSRHPKNPTHGFSLRYLLTASRFSKLTGVPVNELVSAGKAFQELEEQRKREVWMQEVAAGNGRYMQN